MVVPGYCMVTLATFSARMVSSFVYKKGYESRFVFFIFLCQFLWAVRQVSSLTMVPYDRKNIPMMVPGHCVAYPATSFDTIIFPDVYNNSFDSKYLFLLLFILQLQWVVCLVSDWPMVPYHQQSVPTWTSGFHMTYPATFYATMVSCSMVLLSKPVQQMAPGVTTGLFTVTVSIF